MPNIIELNLLENKSIVATMQGYPLANENSYKIIAGEENATKFIIKSIPNQYANARLTVEMVNSQGLGIAERELSEIEVDLVSYKGFILPVGMAVAGYGYVLFRAKYTENGKEVVVPFQPLKIKVWNTLPEWKKHVSNSTNVRIENGYLIINEDGKDYNLGYVKGEKGDSGVEVDSTLSVEGAAADAKATGDALSGKVDKVKPNYDGRFVYGEKKDGNSFNREFIPVSNQVATAGNGKIPQYIGVETSNQGDTSPTGVLLTADPKRPYQTASKHYVDEKFFDGSLQSIKVKTSAYQEDYTGASEQGVFVSNATGDKITYIGADNAGDVPYYYSSDGINTIIITPDMMSKFSVAGGYVWWTYPTMSGELLTDTKAKKMFVSAVETAGRIYGTMDTGVQSTYQVSMTGADGAIPQFSNRYTLQSSGTPTIDYDLTNKLYVDSSLENKLDKITPSYNTTYIYTVTKNGNTITNGSRQLAISSASASNGNIPQYMNPSASYGDTETAGGAVLLTGDPQKPYHTANKRYVDQAIETVGTIYKHDLTIWGMARNVDELYFSYFSKSDYEIHSLQDLKDYMTAYGRLFGYNATENEMQILRYDEGENKFYLNNNEVDVDEYTISFEVYTYEL